MSMRRRLSSLLPGVSYTASPPIEPTQDPIKKNINLKALIFGRILEIYKANGLVLTFAELEAKLPNLLSILSLIAYHSEAQLKEMCDKKDKEKAGLFSKEFRELPTTAEMFRSFLSRKVSSGTAEKTSASTSKQNSLSESQAPPRARRVSMSHCVRSASTTSADIPASAAPISASFSGAVPYFNGPILSPSTSYVNPSDNIDEDEHAHDQSFSQNSMGDTESQVKRAATYFSPAKDKDADTEMFRSRPSLHMRRSSSFVRSTTVLQAGNTSYDDLKIGRRDLSSSLSDDVMTGHSQATAVVSPFASVEPIEIMSPRPALETKTAKNKELFEAFVAEGHTLPNDAKMQQDDSVINPRGSIHARLSMSKRHSMTNMKVTLPKSGEGLIPGHEEFRMSLQAGIRTLCDDDSHDTHHDSEDIFESHSESKDEFDVETSRTSTFMSEAQDSRNEESRRGEVEETHFDTNALIDEMTIFDPSYTLEPLYFHSSAYALSCLAARCKLDVTAPPVLDDLPVETGKPTGILVKKGSKTPVKKMLKPSHSEKDRKTTLGLGTTIAPAPGSLGRLRRKSEYSFMEALSIAADTVSHIDSTDDEEDDDNEPETEKKLDSLDFQLLLPVACKMQEKIPVITYTPRTGNTTPLANCFKGDDAVQWMLHNGCAVNTDGAKKMGTRMVAAGFLKQVSFGTSSSFIRDAVYQLQAVAICEAIAKTNKPQKQDDELEPSPKTRPSMIFTQNSLAVPTWDTLDAPSCSTCVRELNLSNDGRLLLAALARVLSTTKSDPELSAYCVRLIYLLLLIRFPGPVAPASGSMDATTKVDNDLKTVRWGTMIAKKFVYYVVDLGTLSGRKMSQHIWGNMFSMLFNDGENMGTKFERELMGEQPVVTPWVWPCLFACLQKTSLKMRSKALLDINFLLVKKTENCKGILMHNLWQMYVLPLLSDLNMEMKTGVHRDCYRTIMHVFVLVHTHSFSFDPYFESQLSTSLNSVIQYAGFNENSQEIASDMLTTMIKNFITNKSILPPTVLAYRSHYNLPALLQIVRTFCFTTATWQHVSVFEKHMTLYEHWSKHKSNETFFEQCGKAPFSSNCILAEKSDPNEKSKNFDKIKMYGVHFNTKGRLTDITMIASLIRLLEVVHLNVFDASLLPTLSTKDGNYLKNTAEQYALLQDCLSAMKKLDEGCVGINYSPVTLAVFFRKFLTLVDIGERFRQLMHLQESIKMIKDQVAKWKKKAQVRQKKKMKEEMKAKEYALAKSQMEIIKKEVEIEELKERKMGLEIVNSIKNEVMAEEDHEYHANKLMIYKIEHEHRFAQTLDGLKKSARLTLTDALKDGPLEEEAAESSSLIKKTSINGGSKSTADDSVAKKGKDSLFTKFKKNIKKQKSAKKSKSKENLTSTKHEEVAQ